MQVRTVMDRNTPLVLVLGGVILAGLVAAGKESRAAGSKPDFTGNWELNVSQSKFGKMPVPTRMSLEVSRKGDVLHAIQTSYDQAGGPDAAEGDWFLDGKEHPLGTDGKMVSSTAWEGNTLKSIRRSRDGSYEETIHLSMSADGKTATESIEVKGPNGSNKSSLVWSRK